MRYREHFPVSVKTVAIQPMRTPRGHATYPAPLCSGSPAKLRYTTAIGDGTTYRYTFPIHTCGAAGLDSVIDVEACFVHLLGQNLARWPIYLRRCILAITPCLRGGSFVGCHTGGSFAREKCLRAPNSAWSISVGLKNVAKMDPARSTCASSMSEHRVRPSSSQGPLLLMEAPVATLTSMSNGGKDYRVVVFYGF